MPGLPRATRLAAIGTVNNEAFGFATRTCPAGRAGFAACTAIDQYFNLIIGEVSGQFDPDVCARSALMPITAVVTIGACSG